MKFVSTQIPDVVICEPVVFGDDRGYFVETFRADKLAEFLGYEIKFCQDNESKSSLGVLRGLHFQLPPYAQTKLVRVIKGRVIDVAVDIRLGSPTFGKFVATELSDQNKRQLLIPRGFAHGFLVLENDSIFAYKVDSYYNKDCDRGIAYDDADIAIDWASFGISKDKLNLSEKDTKQPSLANAKELFDISVNYYA
ncbi:MAG: dTDP-4-dehydrorhamnose 3,5-epimerase [Campylobacter sp.]|nr:dTDP-4-dehydrorhamnose 3,5-epimerase [Campylobacter sp.]